MNPSPLSHQEARCVGQRRNAQSAAETAKRRTETAISAEPTRYVTENATLFRGAQNSAVGKDCVVDPIGIEPPTRLRPRSNVKGPRVRQTFHVLAPDLESFLPLPHEFV